MRNWTFEIHTSNFRYGPAVIHYYNLPPEERSLTQGFNPMCEAFPRVASCTFWKYGTGGKPVGHNAICILALNMVIDKIYLVLWFFTVSRKILSMSILILQILMFVLYHSGQILDRHLFVILVHTLLYGTFNPKPTLF